MGMPRHACFSPNNCPFAWGIWAPSNRCFLGPARVHNPNGISIGSAIVAQITAECCLHPSPLKITHSHGGSQPHLTRFLGAHPSPQHKRHLDQFSRFCTDDHRMFLYFTMGRFFPLQNCPVPWGDLDPYLIHVLWAHPSLNSNDISIDSAIFAKLTSVTDRQTDQSHYSVCNNKPQLHIA